ncbi:hypothetical protein [Streptomyces sp. NPDC090135]|uniref:hypothetical protein n=1 Tax=Streptomyces sp. NPDC090135 TaxID=3365957 RepID=UPI00382E1D5B
MNTVPELSNVDLVCQALFAAREATKKNGAQTKKPKRLTGTALRWDGREPLGLGAAIGMMMTERGLVAPAVGGSILVQREAILTAAAPELTGHVKAVAFDEESGRAWTSSPTPPHTPRRPAGSRRSSSKPPTARCPRRTSKRSTSWPPLPAPSLRPRRYRRPPTARRRDRSFRSAR